MSIYNHRPMVPNSQTSRLLETLETIKSQFDQLAQEAYICKSQKEDYENKSNQENTLFESLLTRHSCDSIERNDENSTKSA